MTSSGFPLGHRLPWGIYEKIVLQTLVHYRWRAGKIESRAKLNVFAGDVKIIISRDDGTSSSVEIRSARKRFCGGSLPSGSVGCVPPKKVDSVTTSVNAFVGRLNAIESPSPASQSSQQKLLSLARGHAASLIPKIFAIDQVVTIRFEQRVAAQPDIAVTNVGRQSIAYVIASANTWKDKVLPKSSLVHLNAIGRCTAVPGINLGRVWKFHAPAILA